MEKEVDLFNPGPLHDYRFQITDYLTKWPVKTGDIIFRRDNYWYLGIIPFSKLVAHITKSEYVHSALIYILADQVFVLEVNDQGTVLFRLEDWVDLSSSKHFCVYRLKNLDNSVAENLKAEIEKFLKQDPDYNFTYTSISEKFYCTEAVCRIYENIGIKLMEPVYLKNVMNHIGYWIFETINSAVKFITKKGFDINSKMYFVGNDKIGMASCKLIKKIIDINL